MRMKFHFRLAHSKAPSSGPGPQRVGFSSARLFSQHHRLNRPDTSGTRRRPCRRKLNDGSGVCPPRQYADSRAVGVSVRVSCHSPCLLLCGVTVSTFPYHDVRRRLTCRRVRGVRRSVPALPYSFRVVLLAVRTTPLLLRACHTAGTRCTLPGLD